MWQELDENLGGLEPEEQVLPVAVAPVNIRSHGRRCPICCLSIPGNGYSDHVRSCCSVRFVGGPGRIGATDLQDMQLVMSGLSCELRKEFLGLKDTVCSLYEKRGHHDGVRPDHRGVLLGLGWCKLRTCWFGPQSVAEQTLPLVQAFYSKLLSHKIISEWTQCFQNLTTAEQAATPKLPPNDWTRYQTNAFLGLQYEAVKHEEPEWHQPKVPVEVASSMTPMPYWNRQCVDFVACPFCPGHTETFDKSLTLMVAWQNARTPKSKVARMVIGNAAFPIDDGRIFLFDAHRTRHGMWLSHEPSASDWPYYALAIVLRTN